MKKLKKTKCRPISVRLPEKMFDYIVSVSNKECRSISQQVILIIGKDMENAKA